MQCVVGCVVTRAVVCVVGRVAIWKSVWRQFDEPAAHLAPFARKWLGGFGGSHSRANVVGPMSSGSVGGGSIMAKSVGAVRRENVLAVKRLRPTVSGGGQLLQHFIMANGFGRCRAVSTV